MISAAAASALNRRTVRAVLAGATVLALVGYLIVSAPQPAEAARVEANCTNNAATDATMINQAIANSDEGDEIVFSGTCLLNQTIELLQHRSYRGESHTRTVLQQANGAGLDALLATDSYLDNWQTSGGAVSVRDLKLDGNRANNPGAATDGIVLRSFYSKVEDLQIWEVGGHGIRLTSLSANGTVITNTIGDGYISHNFVRGTGGHGIYAEDPTSGSRVTDHHLISNIVSNNDLDGIHLENAAGWLLIGNNVYGAKQNAINAQRMFGTVISNSYIEPFGEGATTGFWHGIRGTLQEGRPSAISGNTVSAWEGNAGSDYVYIGIAAVNSGTGVVSVTGNALRYVGDGTSGGTGLSYRTGGGDALVATSTGNVVVDIDTGVFAGPTATVTAGV